MWPQVREWVFRFRVLFSGRTQLDQDFEDELAFHVAMREQNKAANGSNPAAAQVQARRELGGMEKWKEALRDVRRPRLVENFLSDVSLAVRLLRKSPTFTLVALSTLTLAIGANTAVFTLLDTLMLRPLPVPKADRLTLWRIQPGDYGFPFSYPIFRGLEERSSAFSDVFAFSPIRLKAQTNTGTEKVSGVLVSGHYFSALRVLPETGRWLSPLDDQPGGGKTGAATVISDRFWKEHFNGDIHIIGRKVVLNNVLFTVAGVMPPTFWGADVGQRPDVFVPLAVEPQVDAPLNMIAAGWKAWWLDVGGRLRDGVSLAQANAFLRVRSKSVFAAVIPDPNWGFNNVKRPNLYVSSQAGATGFCHARFLFQKPLLIVMFLVVLVLCVACLNLASLLMARSAARERELATRSALGAGRPRLLQQLLTESLLLAATGTTMGFLMSFGLSRLLASFLKSPGGLFSVDISPDIRVFAFVAAVAALSAALVGIVPALRATGQSLESRIKEGGVSLRGAERRRLWPRVLMGTEIALALLQVTGAGLLGYSLLLLHEAPTGFRPQGLTMLPLQMSEQRRDGKALLQFYQEFAGELSRVRGVKDVSYALVVPLSGFSLVGDFTAEGGHPHQLKFNVIGPHYFSTVGTLLIKGRLFRREDNNDPGHKAILNQAAASLLFPSGHAIGRHVSMQDKTMVEIIGIVGDTKYKSIRDPAPPIIYLSMAQHLTKSAPFTLIFRSSQNPEHIVAGAKAILRRLAPEVPIPAAISMETEIAQSLATERLMSLLASFFAVAALLITGIGLYGMLAYSTARRTGEIGIRMALGAQRGNILGLILRENSLIVMGGCALGLLLSLGCTHFVASLLFGIKASSPMVLGVSSGVLILAGLLASLPPALRATRIDPIKAIRHE